MEVEVEKVVPWPVYIFEVYDNEDSHNPQYLNRIEIQAETYEIALKQVKKRVVIKCVESQ